MKATLVYDGECAICRGAADWVRRNAMPDAFEYLSCHSEELTRRFPAVAREACLQAMHLVLPDGRVLVGEKAAPEILSRLKARRLEGNHFQIWGEPLGHFSQIACNFPPRHAWFWSLKVLACSTVSESATGFGKPASGRTCLR